MPTNNFGDEYEEDQYNGDSTYNGRVETNQMSLEEEGKTFMEDVVVNQLLPTYFPEVKSFMESFNSSSMEVGEYVIDAEPDGHNGAIDVSCEVACNPDTYARLMQLDYNKLEAPLKKVCDEKGYGCQIMTNDDDKESPRIIFQISVY